MCQSLWCYENHVLDPVVVPSICAVLAAGSACPGSLSLRLAAIASVPAGVCGSGGGVGVVPWHLVPASKAGWVAAEMPMRRMTSIFGFAVSPGHCLRVRVNTILSESGLAFDQVAKAGD